MSTGLFQDEEDGYNLDETKYKLKLDTPSEPALPASNGEGDLDSLDGGEPMGEPMGGEPSNDKPFDDKPFEAGVEADENSEPEKYIQQLAGKLGTTLRKYSDERGQPDFDLEKFAINSVISATHSAEMDEEDQNDIINKVKNSGGEEDQGGEQQGGEEDQGGGEQGLDMSSDGGLDNANDEEIPDMNVDETLYEDSLGDDFENNISINELHNQNKNGIFVENNIMPIIRRKLAEIDDSTTQPITKPTETPTETPSPRRKKIWEVKPEVSPRPKAEKASVGFNENRVLIDSLIVENFKTTDYPEFIDATITYGEYVDGTPLNEDELKIFQNNNINTVREIIYERLF